MLKYLLLSMGVTLVVILGLLLDAQSRPVVVRSATPLTEFRVFALGRVEGATQEIKLRPQLTGRIVELLAEEGQFVEEGQTLLQLDDERYGHEVALATALLDLAKARLERLINGARPEERAEAAALYEAKQAELERAQLSWKRIDELSRTRAISQQEADNQRTRVTGMTAEVEAAKARFELLQAEARTDEVQVERARIQAAMAGLELANVQLARTRLQAPSRGQILEIDVEPGELTGPDSSDPAIVLADTSTFRVRAFVEEIDAPRVKLGMPARISADGLPGVEIVGRITRLSPRMGRKELYSGSPTERYDTKTREIWIELAEAADLVAGLRVDCVIDVGASAASDAEVTGVPDAEVTGGASAEPSAPPPDGRSATLR